ncbi:hypothetical protein ACHAWX_004352 [Stephanocyclus meneghinianus]
MSTSSISDDETKTERIHHSNASSSLVSSCRQLVVVTPPLESVSMGKKKAMSKPGNRGVAESCMILVGMPSKGHEEDTEKRSVRRADRDIGSQEGNGGYLDFLRFLGNLSSSDERTDTLQESETAFSAKDSTRYAVNPNSTLSCREFDENHKKFTNSYNGDHDSLVIRNDCRTTIGSRSTKQEKVRESNASLHDLEIFAPQDVQQNHILSDEHSDVDEEDGEQKPRIMENTSSIKREQGSDYDNKANDEWMTLPASTHTLLHTEPINSIAFLFSLGIAALSVSCLLLVLANELSKGQKGNLLDVPTSVSSGVRGAQFCGIFVGLLMEEEIPQGLILLRAISRNSFHETYPELSFTRFVFSCILRLLMGNLFLLNLFVTIVQADDVITIFFDILALEFVQHLDDVAFELGRRDMLGRSLHLATIVEHKVLTRAGFKKSRQTNREENPLIPQREQQQQQNLNWNFVGESMLCCIHRSKKNIHFRWILKAQYFIIIACLLTGTIIVGRNQTDGNYQCKSVSVMFGEHVWENAYVANWTDPFQAPLERTLVYSYFNGVYKITGTDPRGYPIYTESSMKDECLQWLLRSPKSKVYDLIDVPHEDWSVWTGIITPGNKVSVVCNYYGLHCEFREFCKELIDDEGEKYTLAFDTDNSTLLSYMRPIYASRSFYLGDIARSVKLSSEQIGNDAYHSISRPVGEAPTSEVITFDNLTHPDLSSTPLASCYPRAQKVRLESTTGEQISIFEFQVYSSGTNIALQGTATQSSDCDNREVCGASRGIDDDNTTFSQTNDSNAWWEIDLGGLYSIDSVLVVNRYCGIEEGGIPLGCLCRLSNSTITLLDKTEAIVALKTIGNTCDQLTVTKSFTPNYACPCALFCDAPRAFPTNSSTFVKNETDETNTTLSNSTLNEADDNLPWGIQWVILVLVYSGSRWFGTAEFSQTEALDFSTLIYDDEYHAFWDKLYEARTAFISDPTLGATPVGADFYQREEVQWNDYGPFGLLTPFHNISGKGYFHCLGTNLSAVKVASGSGTYGE